LKIITIEGGEVLALVDLAVMVLIIDQVVDIVLAVIGQVDDQAVLIIVLEDQGDLLAVNLEKCIKQHAQDVMSSAKCLSNLRASDRYIAEIALQKINLRADFNVFVGFFYFIFFPLFYYFFIVKSLFFTLKGRF
jgi:hypothetical protein